MIVKVWREEDRESKGSRALNPRRRVLGFLGVLSPWTRSYGSPKLGEIAPKPPPHLLMTEYIVRWRLDGLSACNLQESPPRSSLAPTRLLTP